MKLLFAAIVVAAFALLLPRQKPQPAKVSVQASTLATNPPPRAPLEDSPENIAKRVLAGNQWFTAMKALATSINDTEVNTVVAFFTNHASVSLPHSAGVQTISRAKEGPAFYFIPLLSGDERKSAEWKKQATDKRSVARFLPDMKTLITHEDEPTSPLWKSVILLHETRHAYAFLTRPYNWRDEKLYCYEERDTHEFQNRVVSALGGTSYKTLLEEEVERIKKELAQTGKLVGMNFPNRIPYREEQEAIFGKAESQLEKDYRETSLWIHAHFTLIEREFKGDVTDRKALFLHTIYLRSGILPVK